MPSVIGWPDEVLASESKCRQAHNAFNPVAVTPITISEFSVLEYPAPDKPKLQVHLSDKHALLSPNGKGAVSKDHANVAKPATAENLMQMNGLKFRKGLGVRYRTNRRLNPLPVKRTGCRW
ncbi:MAG: hypothetical protein V4634_06015 [Pseudomonadota bacterium]